MILAEPVHQAEQLDPIIAVLVILAALTVWALSLLAHPIGTCRACHGARVIRTVRTNGRGRVHVTVRPCRGCNSTGYRRRIGATTVHRLYWTFIGERLRQQRRDELSDQLTKRRDDHT